MGTSKRTGVKLKPRKFGWVKDKVDKKDHKFAGITPMAALTLPPVIDMRPALAPVPVEDQGQVGSCTANATVSALEYNHDVICGLEPHQDFTRLGLYYDTRVQEGTAQQDVGASIRTVVKVAATFGVGLESEWPYVQRKWNVRPPAIKRVGFVAEYQRVIGLVNLKAALAMGHTVVFGFQVTEGFMDASVTRTGKAPLWITGERLLGGHAVLAVGYDDAMEYHDSLGRVKGKGCVIFRNSWSNQWGEEGYGFLPYPYITSARMSADFWTIIRCKFSPPKFPGKP